MSRKTAEKSAAKSGGRRQQAKRPKLVKQRHGGALYRGGVRGNKGGPGRPPNEYKRLLLELLNSAEAIEALRAVLTDPHNRNYAAVRRMVEERAYGKVPQAIDANVGGRLLLVRDVSEVKPVDAGG